MKVNQQKIADRLSLSVSTVSRALRNDDSILPTTRAQIFQVASEMGYRPKTRRSRRSSATDGSLNRPMPVIGVYAHEPTEGSWSSVSSRVEAGHYMLSGISTAASRLGMQIFFQSVNDGEIERIFGEPNKPVTRPKAQEVSGVILLYLHKQSAVEQIMRHFPCVSLVNRYALSDLDTVSVDSDKSIREVVERLFELGHRRIGFFNGGARGPWVQDRFSSYIKALLHFQLEFDPRIAMGVYQYEKLDKAQCTQMMCDSTRDGVTAWVCSHDVAGYHVCQSLRIAGFDVPGEVSVVGFDGITPPDDQPQLNTVVSPLQELGEAGVERLSARINDPTMSTHTVLLKCRLLDGETVGPATSSAVAQSA